MGLAIRWQLNSASQQESGQQSKPRYTTPCGHTPASGPTLLSYMNTTPLMNWREKKCPLCPWPQILTPLKTCCYNKWHRNTPAVKTGDSHRSLAETQNNKVQEVHRRYIHTYSSNSCVCICISLASTRPDLNVSLIPAPACRQGCPTIIVLIWQA